ncbi:MAG: SDR family NAD(P)-dependent oxidoreductase [Hyphomicrobiaceae bacterium]
MKGLHVLMTGATNGIGLAAAEALAALGANLTLVGRSTTRLRIAAARALAAGGGQAKVDTLSADLSSQAAVRRLAAEVLTRLPRLDVLVNNAGAMYTRRQIAADGVELTWAVNHLAPYLLTTLLLDRLKASAPARIITTASDAHRGTGIRFDDINAERSYKGFVRYGQTKLANILFTTELAQRLQGSGVTANCYHPGFVATGFNRNNGVLMDFAMTALKPLARSPQKGAETLVWLAASPDVAATSGGYFYDKRPKTPSPAAQDMETARRLWQLSVEQVKRSAAAA